MVSILIVDDEKSICETLTWILEKDGYSVTCEMDFDKAEELIKKTHFDIYFIDLIFPGKNGLDLIRLIRDLKKEGIVIIITGYPNIPTLVESIRLDTYDYIMKPIKEEDLKRTIEQSLKLLGK